MWLSEGNDILWQDEEGKKLSSAGTRPFVFMDMNTQEPFVQQK